MSAERVDEMNDLGGKYPEVTFAEDLMHLDRGPEEKKGPGMLLVSELVPPETFHRQNRPIFHGTSISLAETNNDDEPLKSLDHHAINNKEPIMPPDHQVLNDYKPSVSPGHQAINDDEPSMPSKFSNHGSFLSRLQTCCPFQLVKNALLLALLSCLLCCAMNILFMLFKKIHGIH